MSEFSIIKEILDRYGFPALITIWLIFRNDKRMDRLIEIQQEVVAYIKKHSEGQ